MGAAVMKVPIEQSNSLTLAVFSTTKAIEREAIWLEHRS
jgi:hypothetical protein